MSAGRPGTFARFLKAASKVEENEVRAVTLSFLFSFTLMTAYYILRPIRDAMSSNWTDAELATLWTVTFVSSTVFVTLYGAAVARVKIGKLLPGVYLFFSISFVAFYALVLSVPDAALMDKAFYVWISVFSLFQISVFWSFMADVFSKQQALRVFGFIAAGSSSGAIIGPGLALSLVGTMGQSNLLLLAAALLMIPVAVIPALEKDKRRVLQGATISAQDDYRKTIGGNPFAGFSLLLKSPYLLGIALFLFLYTAISSFVYFELKNLLVDFDSDLRVKVWAGMDLAVNMLAIGTGMFVTGRLANRFGLMLTLTLIPVVIIAGLLVVAMAPVIWVVVGLQVARRAGNYAITRPGREMLFTHVDRETRFKAKTVIDVVVYRGGDTLNAWAFAGLTQGLGLGLGAVAAIGAGIATAWAVVAWLLGRAFHRGHDHGGSEHQ